MSDFPGYFFISAHVWTRAALWLAFQEILFFDKYGQCVPVAVNEKQAPGKSHHRVHTKNKAACPKEPRSIHRLCLCLCLLLDSNTPLMFQTQTTTPPPSPHQKKVVSL